MYSILKFIIFILFLLIALPFNSYAFSLINIRFGQHGNFSRVVFDLDNVFSYKILTENESNAFIIEFQDISKLPDKNMWVSEKTFVNFVRLTKKLNNIRAEIVLQSSGSINRHFMLEKPYRLILDISKSSKDKILDNTSEQEELQQIQNNMRNDIDIKASIRGSATPNERSHRAEPPKHPNNKAPDKSSVHSKSPQVADAVIESNTNTSKLEFSLDHPLGDSRGTNREPSFKKKLEEYNVDIPATLSAEELLAKSEYEWLLGAYDAALLSSKTFLFRFSQHEQNHLVAARLGEILRAQKQYRQALDAYADVAMRYPNSEGARFSQIRMAELRIEFPKLIPESMARGEKRYLPFYSPLETLEQLVQAFPNHPLSNIARYTIGLILLERHDISKAFEVFNGLLNNRLTESLRAKVLSKLRDVLGELLQSYIRNEKYFDALSIYFKIKNKLRAIDRISENLILPVAESYEKLGLLEESEQLLDSLVRSDVLNKSKLYESILKQAEILISLEKYEKATKVLTQAGQFPNKSLEHRANYLLASMSLLNGNPEETVRHLQHIDDTSTLINQQVKIYIHLGASFEKKSLIDQAMNSYQSCLQLGRNELSDYFPDVDICVFRLGLINLEMNRYDKALENFSLLLSSFQNSKYRDETWFKMANIYHKIDDQEKMIETLNTLQERGSNPIWKKMATDILDNIEWRRSYYEHISNF